MSSTSANPKAAAASAASSSGGAAEGVSTSSTSTSAAGPRSSHPLNHAKINNNISHHSNSDDNQSNMDIDDASGGEGDEGHSSGHASGAAAQQGSGPTALHLTSDEVNYLIFRYMQESGFTHSAYTFVYESMLGRSHIRNSEKSVPPGALVSFLQKGLQYVGIEETLQREMQQQQSVGGKTNAAPSPAISESVMNNLSLLAPQTVQAMIRENPPLKLNVPPATAAAAVKARLEAEAQLDKERREEAMKEALARAAVDGVDRNQGRAVILAQPSLLTNPLANAAAFEVQAAQAAAMMQQQHAAVSRQHPHDHPYAAAAAQQQQKQAAQAAGAPPPGHQNPHHHPSAPATERNSASAGAAALMAAQQRRAVAHEIAVLEQQREAQLVQQQLHIQQQLQQEQEKMRQEAAAHALHAQQQQQQKRQSEAAAVALASASDQSRGVAASVSGSNNPPSISSHDDPNALANATMGKRPLGAKKAPKNKEKTPKKTVAGFVGPTAGPNSGFATLEEAVARLEASKASNGGEAATVETPVHASKDVAMVDASIRATPEGKQQQQGLNLHRFKLAQHHPAAAAELAASGGLMNGSHPQGETYFNGSVPNGPVSADPSQQAMMVEGRPPSGSMSLAAQKTPEELAIIDKEDELTNVNPCEVLELKMHQSEVFMCAWNGIFTEMIATGSGDASARIWQMGGPKAADGLGPVRLLPHGTGPRDRKNKDVTTLEWASDGKLLATGSYDGVARVWSLNGALVHTLRGHKGPIFSLKWNKKGNFLLSGSYDKTTIVWDVSGSNGFIEQQFNDHQAPALDVDWKDDTTFASCSTDKTVHICCVGMPRPMKSYTGHTDEVNAVKWDPSGTLLASCSDDCTAKVWDVNSDRTDPLYDFKSHQQEIYTVKWAPTGPGSKNPYKHRMLATASFDGSVRLWNAEDGSCMQVFSRHRDSVYSVAFSPSGSFLASGSLAGQLYIWNVGEGKHIKSFKGKGDIFEVAWNKEETRVAACFSSNVVCIIDFP